MNKKSHVIKFVNVVSHKNSYHILLNTPILRPLGNFFLSISIKKINFCNTNLHNYTANGNAAYGLWQTGKFSNCDLSRNAKMK